MALSHEQQKYELQKRHTVAIQELMDETHSKLSRMQADYDQLTESTVGLDHQTRKPTNWWESPVFMNHTVYYFFCARG